MKTADLEKYQQALLHLQARLRGDVHVLTSKARSGSGVGTEPGSAAAMDEPGSDAWNQHFSLRSAASDQETLAEITEALERIDDGTFGLCQGCIESGKPVSKSAIARTRLNAIPYARNCIECERRREEMV